jgi:hypothetical protein
VVGTNWLGAMGATATLTKAVADLVSRGPNVTSTDPAIAEMQLKARMDAGGMVVGHREIYENDSTLPGTSPSERVHRRPCGLPRQLRARLLVPSQALG